MRLERICCPDCNGKIKYIGNGRGYCERCSAVYDLMEDDNYNDIEQYVIDFFEHAYAENPKADLGEYRIGKSACKFNMSKKRISRLIDICNVPSDETPLMLCDSTLFETRKEGFVLTEKGIYCHNFLENTIKYDWKQFKTAEIFLSEDQYLVIDDMEFDTSSEGTQLAVTLLQLLQKKLKELSVKEDKV